MLLTKKRRNLAQIVMLFGYIFNVSIVSTIVNVLVSTAGSTISQLQWGLLFTMLNVLVMIGINKLPIIKNTLDKIITMLAKKRDKKEHNHVWIYESYGGKVIAEVEVNHIDEQRKGKTIEEIQLKKQHNIQLLVIKRKDQIISEITKDEIIQAGDVIMVFGKMKDIKEIFAKQNEKQEIYS